MPRAALRAIAEMVVPVLRGFVVIVVGPLVIAMVCTWIFGAFIVACIYAARGLNAVGVPWEVSVLLGLGAVYVAGEKVDWSNFIRRLDRSLSGRKRRSSSGRRRGIGEPPV